MATESLAGKLAAERWKVRTARQVYNEFCQETSFSALTRISKASRWYKRILWLIACLAMLTWLSVQCVWLFQKYFRYPVEVEIKVSAVPNIAFPSVTVCNINPLKSSMLTGGPFESIRDHIELDDDDILYDDYIDQLRHTLDTANMTYDYQDPYFWENLLKNRSFNKWGALENDTNIRERFYSQMDAGIMAAFAYSSEAVRLTTDQLRPYGHQIEDLIIACTWQGAACSPANFTYLRNNIYGNCYTLNAFDNGMPALSSNYAGPLMGLSLEMNIEQDEYVPAISPDAGIKIVIHERGTYPIPEDEGLALPPGHKTSIGLDRQEITRLTPPHGDCGLTGQGVVDMYTEEFGTAYSKSTCLKSCVQSNVLRTCNCASPFFYVPEGSGVCGRNNSVCVDDEINNVLAECNERCPTQCLDTKFDFKRSMSQWPSEKYEKHLTKKITKSSSHFMHDGNRQGTEKTLVKVDIYYNELMKETIVQNKAYEVENLISDIGGQLGLWLGLSAITVGEVIELLASLLRLLAARRCGKHEQKTHVMPLDA